MELVSIIIPTYSRSEYIERAINSVLNQTYRPIEIIVVDDNGLGSEYQKSTKERLKDFIANESVTYIPHDVNRNGAAARNTGFRASKGSFITFLDDDDEMLPTKIEKQVNAIKKSNGDAFAAYCGCLLIRNNNIFAKKYAIKSGNLKKELLAQEWGFGSGSNILFKREAIEFLGGFDESFVRHQDLEFVVRFFRYYDIINVNEFLLINLNSATPFKKKKLKY